MHSSVAGYVFWFSAGRRTLSYAAEAVRRALALSCAFNGGKLFIAARRHGRSRPDCLFPPFRGAPPRVR
ncbi:hypothetical protein MPLB_1870046 [Mesorhizobium sp. ORS 3324]|nr:hypothetical protein MPLB_1870046 [Mesorhizobium sp. ORS 3324]